MSTYKLSTLKKVYWFTQHAEAAIFKRDDGIRLGVFMQKDPDDGLWQVFALETAEATMEGVFDNHAHQIIRKACRSRVTAQKAAMAFVRKWLRSSVTSPACVCEEIKPAPMYVTPEIKVA